SVGRAWSSTSPTGEIPRELVRKTAPKEPRSGRRTVSRRDRRPPSATTVPWPGLAVSRGRKHHRGARARSVAAFELGDVGVELQPGLAEPFAEQASGRAVQVHLADGPVDGLAAAQVALSQPDAVSLVGERRVQDADRRGTGGKARQDQVIGGDGV